MGFKDGKHISTQQCQGHLTAMGDALYVIGGKWKLRIIIALADGNKRFNELQRSIQGISARMLSSELKELELNGFINRKVYDTMPVTVEYELTEYSDTLESVVKALVEWGTMHRQTIMKGMKQEKEKAIEAAALPVAP